MTATTRNDSGSAVPILVRHATTADCPTIVEFNKAIAQETEGKVLDGGVLTAGVEAALADRNCALYFVAEIGGEVAGQTMVTTEWSDWRNGHFWWIQSVYVAPRFRRMGVFRALHAFIQEEARRRKDVCGLRLYVHHDNHQAMNVYRSLGMTQTEYLLLEEDWSESRTGRGV